MPKITNENGYYIDIYTRDHPPPHVHVTRLDGFHAKIEIETLIVISYQGQKRHLKKAISLVEKNKGKCLKIWRLIHE